MCRCCPSIYRPALPNFATIVAYDVVTGEKMYASERVTHFTHDTSAGVLFDQRGHVWELGNRVSTTAPWRFGRRLSPDLTKEREVQSQATEVGTAYAMPYGPSVDGSIQAWVQWRRVGGVFPSNQNVRFFDTSGSTILDLGACQFQAFNPQLVPAGVKDFGNMEVYYGLAGTTAFTTRISSPSGNTDNSFTIDNTVGQVTWDSGAWEWTYRFSSGSDRKIGRRSPDDASSLGDATISSNPLARTWPDNSLATLSANVSSAIQGGGTLRTAYRFPGGNGFNSYASGTQVVIEWVLFEGATEVWAIDRNVRTYGGNSNTYTDSCAADNKSMVFSLNGVFFPDGYNSVGSWGSDGVRQPVFRVARDADRTYVLYGRYSSITTHAQYLLAVNNDGSVAWDIDLGITSSNTGRVVQSLYPAADRLFLIGDWEDSSGRLQVACIDPVDGTYEWKQGFTTPVFAAPVMQNWSPLSCNINPAGNVLYVVGTRGGI